MSPCTKNAANLLSVSSNSYASGDDDYVNPFAAFSVSLIVSQPDVSSTSSLSVGAVIGIIVGSVIGVSIIVFILIASGVLSTKAMVLGNGFSGGYGGAMDSSTRHYRNVEMNNPPAGNPMYYNKDQV
jgi:hypothetical protein